MSDKKIKVQLKRDYQGDCELYFPETGDFTLDFCWRLFRKYAPNLCKGLRKNQSRNLILTQTPKGIKLEKAGK